MAFIILRKERDVEEHTQTKKGTQCRATAHNQRAPKRGGGNWCEREKKKKKEETELLHEGWGFIPRS